MTTSLVTPGCASKIYAHQAMATPGAADFAEVWIIREKEFAGGAVPVRVELEGEPIVSLRTGRYAVVRLRPRTYTHLGAAQERSIFGCRQGTMEDDLNYQAGLLEWELEAGRQYFVRIRHVGMVPFSNVPVFGAQSISPEAGQRAIEGYERVGN